MQYNGINEQFIGLVHNFLLPRLLTKNATVLLWNALEITAQLLQHFVPDILFLSPLGVLFCETSKALCRMVKGCWTTKNTL